MLCLLALPIAAPRAATIHVPTDHGSVLTALFFATAGDTVLVAPGTYAEGTLSPADGVVLRGGGAGPEDVVVDGQGATQLMSLWGQGESTRVENLTLRGGAGDYGGGIVAVGSQARFEDCVIEYCQATEGGGLWTRGNASALRFERCVFRDNVAESYGGAVYQEEDGLTRFVDCEFLGNRSEQAGGGLYVHGGTSRLEGCTLAANWAEQNGGAIRVYPARVEVDDCVFESNASGSYGGCLSASSSELICVNSSIAGSRAVSSSAAFDLHGPAGTGWELRDCEFVDNEVSASALIGEVVDLFLYDDGLLLENLSFRDNGSRCISATAQPGDGPLTLQGCLFAGTGGDDGVLGFNLDAILMGCTLVGNSTYGDWPLITELAGHHLEIRETIIADNGPASLVGISPPGTLDVSCTDIHGNDAGDWTGDLAPFAGVAGNLSLAPLFCDAPAGDFTLHAGSPCLPENNDCGVRMGAFGQGCDLTAVGESPAAARRVLEIHPNPCNPRATLRFATATEGPVSLDVYDLAGRRVSLLLRGDLVAGEHVVQWDGAGQPSGFYFAVLRAEGKETAEKLVLLK